MSPTILQVAKQILIINGETSAMKLQKLCYFTQGYYLAVNNGTPLFDEKFEAWRYGPVCRELYKLHSGKNSVSPDSKEFAEIEPISDTYDSNFIQQICDIYKDMTGLQMGDISHTHEAWKSPRTGLNDSDRCDTKMENEKIRQDFLKYINITV